MKKLILAATLLSLAGCGDAIYQTRYVPRASQLTWDAEYKQLPWREPALGENHYTYHPDPPLPHAKEDAHFNRGSADPMNYHYVGDGDQADRASSLSKRR